MDRLAGGSTIVGHERLSSMPEICFLISSVRYFIRSSYVEPKPLPMKLVAYSAILSVQFLIRVLRSVMLRWELMVVCINLLFPGIELEDVPGDVEVPIIPLLG
jgi:hypothetical protein